DDERKSAERAEAVRTLGLAPFSEMREILPGLLQTRQPQEVQLAALSVLGRYPDAEIGGILIDAWSAFSPKMRAAAAEVIFSRPEWLLKLLDAVDNESIPISELEPARVRLLESHSRPDVRERAARLAGRLQLGRRQDVIDRYKSSLALAGDAARGKVH